MARPCGSFGESPRLKFTDLWSFLIVIELSFGFFKFPIAPRPAFVLYYALVRHEGCETSERGLKPTAGNVL